jgi:ribonuclease HII
MIVGLDEAGRGPLAGPVAACALYLVKEPPFKPRDSKELSSGQREEYSHWLRDNSLFGMGFADHAEIDRINILEATFLAFERALKELLNKEPSLEDALFIVDGNHFHTDRNIKYKCVVKADKTVKEVSCASIMAKVARDALMCDMDKEYPAWQFARHKGYPTELHRALIVEHGLCPQHRRSFGPCKKSLAGC